MELDKIKVICHDTQIFAIAISRDEKLLACGGSEGVPITVWDLSEGANISRLVGLNHQVYALAFSSDSSILAAANLWGQIAVWNVADGQLLQEKPETKSRKIRSLIYADSSKKSSFPIMLSDSIHKSSSRVLASNGKFLAISESSSSIKILKYRSTTELAQLDTAKYEVSQSSIRKMVWSVDSKLLAMAGEGWVGIWSPFEQGSPFYVQKLTFSDTVDAIAVLSKSMQIIYARGKDIEVLDMPNIPSVPMLTKWQKFKNQVADLPVDAKFRSKNEWKWNITQWGYEGVHTFEGCLLWFSESYPAYAGGSASEQSFASFLEDGPSLPVPDPILIEVYQAVRMLT